ncbi:hypothetical protein AALF85_10310 [Jeotgalicoccus halotolerans]|uniref:hypothetical protein n=1 Tax=Jeotgalicoccus halotolerans TaxID=157227 RepID=UPI0035174818
MSKGNFLLLLVIISLLTLIITDFFPGTEWYIQYGPLILTAIIIFIMAIFEKKEVESKKIESADEKRKQRNKFLAFIAFIWLIVMAMNIFAGEPEADIFNIKNPEFWILIVILPLLSQFNYKKITDGT